MTSCPGSATHPTVRVNCDDQAVGEGQRSFLSGVPERGSAWISSSQIAKTKSIRASTSVGSRRRLIAFASAMTRALKPFRTPHVCHPARWSATFPFPRSFRWSSRSRRRPPGRRARILRRPRHFLVDQQCSEMRLRLSGLRFGEPPSPHYSRSEPEWPEFRRVRHRADRRPLASCRRTSDMCIAGDPRLPRSAGPETPRPKYQPLSHAARYAGVPTGSPCVLVLGLCGLCRSNCRTMGLLRARLCRRLTIGQAAPLVA